MGALEDCVELRCRAFFHVLDVIDPRVQLTVWRLRLASVIVFSAWQNARLGNFLIGKKQRFRIFGNNNPPRTGHPSSAPPCLESCHAKSAGRRFRPAGSDFCEILLVMIGEMKRQRFHSPSETRTCLISGSSGA